MFKFIRILTNVCILSIEIKKNYLEAKMQENDTYKSWDDFMIAKEW